MKKQRIFISSTFLDLIPHRQRIWDLLQSYKVEISGMEKFGVRSETSLETCLKEVKSCNLFIGIIGMRYGSLNDDSYKSFSRLEYEEALKEKKIIFIYLIDEARAKISPNFIDCENYLHLKKFKELVSKNHTIDTFISEKDLVKKLDIQLKHILDDESRIPNYRPERIEAELDVVEIEGIQWLVVLGLKYGNPYEIYAVKKEWIFDISPDLKECYIVKRKDYIEDYRFDFEYHDEEGYKTTIEGLSRFNNTIISLVSKLLEKEVPINKIIEIINETNFNLNKKDKITRRIVLHVLLKKYKNN